MDLENDLIFSASNIFLEFRDLFMHLLVSNPTSVDCFSVGQQMSQR